MEEVLVCNSASDQRDSAASAQISRKSFVLDPWRMFKKKCGATSDLGISHIAARSNQGLSRQRPATVAHSHTFAWKGRRCEKMVIQDLYCDGIMDEN